MTRIAYYRVSTGDQSIEAQRATLGGQFDREFEDIGISGATLAADRPGFAQLTSYVREGDTVHVYAVDRLGRDALDVQSTVRKLLDMGVTLEVRGLGSIGRGVGELVLAVLAQVADMERNKIKERCDSGREAARAALAATGKTHRGKSGLGRRSRAESLGMAPAEIAAWRRSNSASIAQTAEHFGIGTATVKRYCAEDAPREAAARKQQERFEADLRRINQMDRDAERIEAMMGIRRKHLDAIEHGDASPWDEPSL